MKIVPASSEQYSNTSVLFEPLKTCLSARLIDSLALAQVVGSIAYIPVVNVGTTNVLLYPYTVVGTVGGILQS